MFYRWLTILLCSLLSKALHGAEELVVVGGDGSNCIEDSGCVNRLHPLIPMTHTANPGQTILFRTRDANGRALRRVGQSLYPQARRRTAAGGRRDRPDVLVRLHPDALQHDAAPMESVGARGRCVAAVAPATGEVTADVIDSCVKRRAF